MCQSITCGKQDIANIYQLKREIGRRNVVIRPGYHKPSDHTCLCPVDIEASARRAGRQVRRTEWPMEWVMEPRA